MGPSSCAFKAVELSGPVIDAMSVEGRQTVCGQAMFLGATTMLIAPDAKTLAWLDGRQRLNVPPVFPDPDAVYERSVTIDVSDLAPIVVVPPSPANTRDLTDHWACRCNRATWAPAPAAAWKTCASPPRCCAAARCSPASSCMWCPPRRPSWPRAAREGLLTTLVEAGAFVSSPTCDYCYGRIATMADGQRAVSTGTLNTPGRMGSVDSEIYICNAAVVAASAIEGCIADPRPYLRMAGGAA